MSFQIGRLRTGDWIIAVGAIALFVFMFFFKWFAVEVPAIVSMFVLAGHASTSVNAWNALEVLRWLLLLTIVSSAVWVVLRGLDRELNMPISLSAIVAGLGAVCTLLVFYRALISHPFTHAEVKLGAWLGLISCAFIAYGGYRSMSEEETALADVREPARAPFDSVTVPAGDGAASESRAGVRDETPAAPLG